MEEALFQDALWEILDKAIRDDQVATEALLACPDHPLAARYKDLKTQAVLSAGVLLGVGRAWHLLTGQEAPEPVMAAAKGED